MKHWQTLSMAGMCLALAACTGKPEGQLVPGDLLFQCCQGNDFTDAIKGATANATDYTHVGIFALVDGREMVIEANPSKGVTITPLDTFMQEPVVAMRVDSKVADPRVAVKRARKMVGRPYDWEFSSNNGAIYCSELVQLAFIDEQGFPIFESEPMNFMAADTMPQFWVDLFEEMDRPIPQGEPGTNPNSIAASPLLRVIPLKEDGSES